MQRLPFFLLSLACTHLLSLNAQYCNDTRFTEAQVFSDDQIITEFNIPYGLADEWFLDYPQPNLNSFDIAYPDPAIDPMEKRPVIILAHGGGFWGGEKEALSYHITELAKSGYVAVSMNYRKGWAGSPDDCYGDPASLVVAIYRAMQDVQAGMRYIVYNADTYGIDTAHIFAGGESAGVYAMMGSEYYTQEEFELIHPGFGDLYGPIKGETNEIDIDFSIKGFVNMWGGLHDTTYVSASDAIPTISFYGNLDDVIPPIAGTIQSCPDYEPVVGGGGLGAYLTNLGVCNVVHANPIQGHEAYDPSYCVPHIACFFKSLMCDACMIDVVSIETADCAEQYASPTTAILDQQVNEVALFPNPATDVINLQLSENMNSNQLQIIVFNMQGEIMSLPYTISGNRITCRLNNVPAGAYIIRLSAGAWQNSQSFIIAE